MKFVDDDDDDDDVSTALYTVPHEGVISQEKNISPSVKRVICDKMRETSAPILYQMKDQ